MEKDSGQPGLGASECRRASASLSDSGGCSAMPQSEARTPPWQEARQAEERELAVTHLMEKVVRRRPKQLFTLRI